MIASPPVHQQRDWRHLQRVTVQEHRALGAMVQKSFRAQLVCAASIAVWLLQHRPDLAARPTLHVLIAQATEFEALDSGRWLQFIPWFLGRPGLQLRVSIVGELGIGAPDVEGVPEEPIVPVDSSPAALEERLRTHSWSLVKARAPAELVQGSVADWRLRSSPVDPRQPDLCAVFSPEFARHHGSLLDETGLLPLLREGTPLALFSSTEAEQLVDVYTLDAFGLRLRDRECWPNPWALEASANVSEGAYARMGWAGEFDAVPGRPTPDRARLCALDEALRYVRDLLDASGDDAFLTLGEALNAAPDTAGCAASVLLRLPGAVAVDTDNGHVYQIGEGTAWLLERVAPLPAIALASFPGHDDLVSRAMWAVDIHRRYVQPCSHALDEALRLALGGKAAADGATAG